MKKTRVVFMGTPEFSVPILEMLIKKMNVVGVVTQPDKLVGRKRVLTPSPIKKLALDNNIKVLTPKRIKDEYDDVIKLKPDIIITCAFGQMVPVEILNYPKYGCINVHASLLPKYRGGAPIQRAIMNGEEKTGITIMYMNEGMDTGDMISKQEVLISKTDNYETLSDKLMILGRDLLERTIPDIISGKINAEKQDDSMAVYAPIIKREDEKLDFNKTSFELFNHIRGLNPNPGAYTTLNGKIVKVFSSRVSDHIHLEIPNGEIVKIYDDGIGVSTKDSEIILTEIQLEGKKRVNVSEFLKGRQSNQLIGMKFE